MASHEGLWWHFRPVGSLWMETSKGGGDAYGFRKLVDVNDIFRDVNSVHHG